VSPSVNMLVSVAVFMAVVALGMVMVVMPAAFLPMIMVSRFAVRVGMRVRVRMIMAVVRSCVLCLVCGVSVDDLCSVIAVVCLGQLC